MDCSGWSCDASTCLCSGSLLKGIRTCVTDVDGNRGPVHRGQVDFEVGQQEIHLVRIEVDEAGKVNAYVDDMLVEANQFPELQARILKVIGILSCSCWALQCWGRLGHFCIFCNGECNV